MHIAENSNKGMTTSRFKFIGVTTTGPRILEHTGFKGQLMRKQKSRTPSCKRKHDIVNK